jgi:hypothetical protein
MPLMRRHGLYGTREMLMVSVVGRRARGPSK